MPEQESDVSPRLRLNLNVERPTSESMRLQTLHVVLRSNQGDTLRDTITDLGGSLSGASVVLNPPQHHGQVLTPRYDLPRGGHWTCHIRSVDLRDSVIHEEQCDAGVMEPGEIRDLGLKLSARVAAYEGVFKPHASTPGGRDIAVQRFELDVDGRTHCASGLPEASTGSAVKIACEYLPTGSRVVTTRIYGTLGNDTTSLVLWEGQRHLEINAGTGAAVPVPLVWNRPPVALGKSQTLINIAGMDTELRLGRVGHVVMNVTMSAAVVL